LDFEPLAAAGLLSFATLLDSDLLSEDAGALLSTVVLFLATGASEDESEAPLFLSGVEE
jgi:hypothetical protein